MFGTVLISVCTLMHIYVFWRAATVPIVRQWLSGKHLIFFGLILWGTFFLGRVFGHHGTGNIALVLEFLGMNWMAVLFLTFICLLAIDFITLFGFLMPRIAPQWRGFALVAGGVLSLIALFQGMRPPVVQSYNVHLPGLASELDGTVLVAMSDMHLGSLLGERWLAARVAQVNAQQPDLVVLLGDLFEGHGPPQDELLSIFRRISPPLGVWAVPGNHEFHGGSGNMHLAEAAGFQLLRNRWFEIRPGFILAGVDDLTTMHRRAQSGDPITSSLSGRPAGATILLSHTPWQAETAARAGAGLMLSGHTHGGQIWPFSYLIGIKYPLLEGRYEVNDMTVIVCRGTGTWGPRMRLWRPGEILRVTLRKKEAG